MTMNRLMMLACGVCTALTLSGCYTPGGGIMPKSGGPQTYPSTETRQTSLVMLDMRDGKEFFAIDIPPGKQLVIQFVRGDGDDPVLRPDLLRYEVMDNGESTGKLENSMSVPNGPSRRIDVFVNQKVAYATAPAQRQLRTDEVADRPDWWTAEGGPAPKETGTSMYDD
jgi:hypothetical protein